jgi:DNA-directed RNA polymerase subunit L
MKLNAIKGDKNLLEVEVGGESVGFVNLIKEELWNDKAVDEAAYIKEHPYMAEPKIYLKTKEKEPKSVIQNAVKRIMVKLKDLEKEFKRALKD